MSDDFVDIEPLSDEWNFPLPRLPEVTLEVNFVPWPAPRLMTMRVIRRWHRRRQTTLVMRPLDPPGEPDVTLRVRERDRRTYRMNPPGQVMKFRIDWER